MRKIHLPDSVTLFIPSRYGEGQREDIGLQSTLVRQWSRTLADTCGGITAIHGTGSDGTTEEDVVTLTAYHAADTLTVERVDRLCQLFVGCIASHGQSSVLIVRNGEGELWAV